MACFDETELRDWCGINYLPLIRQFVNQFTWEEMDDNTMDIANRDNPELLPWSLHIMYIHQKFIAFVYGDEPECKGYTWLDSLMNEE